MTVAAIRGHDDFSTGEWNRLSVIATKYEPRMRLAYTRAIRDGRSVDQLELRQAIISILAEVCRTSAPIYGIVFNPNSPIYTETIDRLVDKYVSIVDSQAAREEVKRILPPGLTLAERRERLNTFGLDPRSAVQVEKYRQERGNSPSGITDIARVRNQAIQTRGNTIANTEVNRIVNSSLESLWLDNLANVSKAVEFYDRSVRDINNLPRSAKKEWITRRDGRVCNYCDPLDGISAPIGAEFDTEYGYFMTPPIHPHCRCFVIVRAR